MATTIGTITNGNIVSEEWQGTGVFDALMNAVNKNIEIQFNKGRIAGPDYANVYLGGIQAVLQQSIAFALQKDTSDAQVAEILDSTIRANTQLQDQLLTAIKQRLAIDKDIETKDQQILNMQDELLTASKQRDLIDKQLLKAKVDNRAALNVLNASTIDYVNKTERELLGGATYVPDTLASVNSSSI